MNYTVLNMMTDNAQTKLQEMQ